MDAAYARVCLLLWSVEQLPDLSLSRAASGQCHQVNCSFNSLYMLNSTEIFQYFKNQYHVQIAYIISNYFKMRRETLELRVINFNLC